MKHSKPHVHYRRIKTKRGTVRKLINKHIKYKNRRRHNYGSVPVTYADYLRSLPTGTLKDMLQEDRPIDDMSDIVDELRRRGESPAQQGGNYDPDKESQNYGFLFKSTNWRELASEKKRREKEEGFYFGPDGKLVEGVNIQPFEVLKYVDIDRGLSEMKSKGVEIHPSRERLIRQYVKSGEYPKAYEVMPPAGKVFLNLAKGSPDVVYSNQRNKEIRVARR